MAEVFVGKWRPDRSSYTGAEEYFAALGQPDMLKEFEAASETEVTLNGNVLTFVTQIEGKGPRTDVARIGETDEVTLPNSPPMQAKTRLEGDRLVSDLYIADNHIMTFVRYVKGNELFQELTAKGKTFTFKAVRA
ncbi:unnamed protein product [Candidula unifasciata]|uniref:Fatty acid-binding protein n=1 Tax=Candidula unifasciata TaxID=100452 RepID=A0A8S4A8I6_9EUPU|nr:unnamed protein product [Candidula unifasciata]